MRLLLPLASAVLLLATALTGCRKENGLDNYQVIQKPYSLFVSDSAGGLYNTNDGNTYRELFRPDGIADRSLMMVGRNLLWAKNSLYLSENNGSFSVTPAFPANDFLPFRAEANWQSLLLNVPSHGRVYAASRFFSGITYSEDSGKTWVVDTPYADRNVIGHAQSFAQLANGLLVARNNNDNAIAYRTAKTARWISRSTPGLPSSGKYYLTHLQNTLVAIDQEGASGAWYSTDTGQNWTAYTGLPTGEKLLCSTSPFESTVLIGTNGGHIYRLENGTFVMSNTGLLENSIVRGLTHKSDLYKNGRELRYVYASTSTGLYRSENGGRDWVVVRRGDFQTVY